MHIKEKDKKLNISFEKDNDNDIQLWEDENGAHAKIGEHVYGDGASGSQVWEAGQGECSVQQKGTRSVAEADYSLAEGEFSRVIIVDGAIERYNDGRGAHAEGGGTTASGSYSHAEGNNTITNNPYEHAEGHFNISNTTTPVYPHAGNTIHSIGIGSNLQNRKNAVEVMQNGDVYVIGIGGFDGTNFADAKTLQEVINEL